MVLVKNSMIMKKESVLCVYRELGSVIYGGYMELCMMRLLWRWVDTKKKVKK